MHLVSLFKRGAKFGAAAPVLAVPLFYFSACTPKPSVSYELPPSVQTDLQPDPALVTGVLDNGLRYLILRNQTPAGTGALRVQFQTGSLNEVPGTEGLAHYLEHMAFNGSTHVPEGEMINILERLGLGFGADTNASTGLERTVYKLNLPSLDTQVLDAAFMLMQETAQHLTLDQAAIEREMGIILSEKRTRDTANYRAWEARMRFITKNSDLMERLPIGNETSLRSISAKDFKTYYAGHYHPEKTIVAFVGDIEPKVIVEYIENTFADWKPLNAPLNDRPASPATALKGQVEVYAEDGLATNVSLMALRPYQKKPDNIANRNQALIEDVAIGMVAHRMRDLTMQADRPFIHASMTRLKNFELTEGITFNAYAKQDSWEQALIGLDAELRKVLEYGFSQQELDAQLARVQSLYEARASGAATRPTIARRGGLIDQLMASVDNETVFTHPKQNLEHFMLLKPSIKLQHVNTAMSQLWGELDNTNVFLSTSAQIPELDQQISQMLVKNRQNEITNPHSNNALATTFAYSDFGEAGEIASHTYNKEVDAHFITFKNNVHLNFKQTDFEENRVSVWINFGDGNLSAPRKSEGLKRMASGVVSGSGLEKHSVAEVRRLMAGKLVVTNGFNFRTDGDRFFMNAVTVPADFRAQLDIFAANLSAKEFQADARINHINKMKAWFPRHDTTINGVVEKYVPRIIRGGDIRFGFDNENDFYEASLEEVEAWLKPQFFSGQIEITVIGDIERDAVIRHVAQTLGALPKRDEKQGSYPEMRAINFPRSTEKPLEIYHKGDDNQAQLRIYWPASDGLDPVYSHQLSVLQAILRNRLVKEIREGEATTYSPQAAYHTSQVFPGYGYIAAVLTLKPEDLAAMAEKVQSITQDITKNKIKEDEFVRAVTPIIKRLESRAKQNAYWLSVLADAQTDALGLQHHLTREDSLKAMSVEDIQKLADSIFQQEQSIEIRVLPKIR